MAETNIDTLHTRRQQLREHATILAGRLAKWEQAATTITETRAAITAAETHLAKATQRLNDLCLIRDEFRPSGIPSKILAGVVDELNMEANSMMDATADDGLQVQVSVVKATQKGSLTEAVTIYAITTDGCRVDYSTLSGSEQFRVALGIRLGLARCIARRTGVPIRLLTIDEGWGNLDEPTRRNVAGVLSRLSAEFQVITVSHIDDVKESFPTMVTVDAGSGSSVATIHTS